MQQGLRVPREATLVGNNIVRSRNCGSGGRRGRWELSVYVCDVCGLIRCLVRLTGTKPGQFALQEPYNIELFRCGHETIYLLQDLLLQLQYLELNILMIELVLRWPTPESETEPEGLRCFGRCGIGVCCLAAMTGLAIMLHLLNKILDNVPTSSAKSDADWPEIEEPSTGPAFYRSLCICTTCLVHARQWLLARHTASAIRSSASLSIRLRNSPNRSNRTSARRTILLAF